MIFRVRQPGPALAPFVEFLWLYENDPRPHALERIMPTGAAQLVVNLAEHETRVYDEEGRCETSDAVSLSGAHSRYAIIDTREQQAVAGVTFRPGGASAFLAAPSDEITNLHASLGDLWRPRDAARMRERLLEADGPDAKLDALHDEMARALRRAALHPAVAYALGVFGRAPRQTSIGSVTDAIGISAKRFIECFRAQVGLTPKAYCRVRRFQQALGRTAAGGTVDWTDVALSVGYYDQAHFIHDFRAFAGITPTVYLASRTEYRNHVKFLQSSPAGL
jgi:AraC-like DNA-binding protein